MIWWNYRYYDTRIRALLWKRRSNIDCIFTLGDKRRSEVAESEALCKECHRVGDDEDQYQDRLQHSSFYGANRLVISTV